MYRADNPSPLSFLFSNLISKTVSLVLAQALLLVEERNRLILDNILIALYGSKPSNIYLAYSKLYGLSVDNGVWFSR